MEKELDTNLDLATQDLDMRHQQVKDQRQDQVMVRLLSETQHNLDPEYGSCSMQQ